ncbi:acyltransferase family protein [Parasphingorhabdus sp.]|uniref:acyltransferase family protein n=1 Tax=Parasphingorhabdus sp. TaxID=2709688 RepID=UPI003BAF6D18
MQNTSLLTNRIGQDQSQLIKVARVVCIIFMMTTHIWPGSDRILAASQPFAIEAFFVLVVDSLGRASVPLLSLISGLLIVHSFDRRHAIAVMKTKPATLLVPMIVWSIPVVLLLFVEQRVRGETGLAPDTLMEWLNSFFALTASPANGPLHFLREIFIMSCYAWLVLTIYRRSPKISYLVMFGIFLLEQMPSGFLLFRNQIATFYLVGMALALAGQARWTPGWPLVLSLLAFFIITSLFDLPTQTKDNFFAFRFFEHVPRIAMSLLMWRLAYELVMRNSRITGWLSWLEPHIFTIFCSHAITIKFFGGVAHVLKWSESDPWYILIFLVQIPICLIVGIIASKILTPLPWLRGKMTREKKAYPSGAI